ncbi:MAG: branched-chain amino acid transport system permease protein livM [Actinomycetota bacterium]|nr:branched-chain amino acid transport system permease protein livM [Actinomycetota bacterium]
MKRWSNLAVTVVAAVLVVFVVKESWAGHPVDGTAILNLLVFALPLAGVYAISAAGLVVVYTTTGIFNFAQGAVGMFMAYLYWELHVNHGVPTLFALILVVLVAAPLLGVALDRAIMRRLEGQPLVVQLMVTVGLMLSFMGLAATLWDQNTPHQIPTFFGTGGFHIGDVILSWHRFTIIVVALVLAVSLRFLLFNTRLGVAMRAVVDNRELAALAGARPDVVSGFSWALGCSLAAIAGILIAPDTGMAVFGSLSLIVINAFVAAIVGRLRSLPFTYIGALLLALAIQFSQQFLALGQRWAQAPLALPTIMLFIVLLLLPQAKLQYGRIGGARRIERVSTVRDTAIGMAVLVVVMAIVGNFLSSTNVNRLTAGMATALIVLSLVPLTGWAGQVSLAPLAFAGFGAVAYAKWGGAHGSLLAVVLATLITVPIGAIMAIPALRLQGLYLALASLAFASMAEYVIFTQPELLGSQSAYVARLKVFGLDFSGRHIYLVLITAVFGITSIGVVALRRSAFGRRLVAMRDSEAASATIGVNILETKVAVFMLSAGIAGFAGAFLAQQLGSLSSSNFTMLAGLPMVLALVIGGVASVAGALFAGVFGFVLIYVKDTWHLSLWRSLEILGPGLAALGIIRNPSGAVIPIGDAFAPLLPWRKDAKERAAADKARTAVPEIGELGLTRPFTASDVAEIERELGVADELIAHLSPDTIGDEASPSTTVHESEAILGTP